MLEGAKEANLEQDTSLPRNIEVDRDEAAAAGVPSSLPMPSIATIAEAQREQRQATEVRCMALLGTSSRGVHAW